MIRGLRVWYLRLQWLDRVRVATGSSVMLLSSAAVFVLLVGEPSVRVGSHAVGAAGGTVYVHTDLYRAALRREAVAVIRPAATRWRWLPRWEFTNARTGVGRATLVRCPLWMISAFGFAVAGRPLLGMRPRAGERLCPRCGYDLRGLDAETACPECGR